MINAIRMLTIDEGCKYNSYKDTLGNTTIGIGFNMSSPNAIEVWKQSGIKTAFSIAFVGQCSLPQNEVWDLLNTCIDNAKSDLLEIFHDFDSLPEHVQLVLINLIFNMGMPVFQQFKQFISLIKSGNYLMASDDLKHTKWAGQVPNRAKRVIALLQGDDSLYG